MFPTIAHLGAPILVTFAAGDGNPVETCWFTFYVRAEFDVIFYL